MWEEHAACTGEVKSAVLYSNFERHRPLENISLVTVLK